LVSWLVMTAVDAEEAAAANISFSIELLLLVVAGGKAEDVSVDEAGGRAVILFSSLLSFSEAYSDVKESVFLTRKELQDLVWKDALVQAG
jgi:hypothetical protein